MDNTPFIPTGPLPSFLKMFADELPDAQTATHLLPPGGDLEETAAPAALDCDVQLPDAD